MTVATILASCGALTATAVAVAAEANGHEPWWFVAIVVPLAGFCATLVWWILKSQKDRELALEARDAERAKAESARETRREMREDQRIEQAELQTQAMRECVAELQRLSHQQQAHAAAIADLPRRLAEVVVERRAT
jgi:hypothetical protein